MDTARKIGGAGDGGCECQCAKAYGGEDGLFAGDFHGLCQPTSAAPEAAIVALTAALITNLVVLKLLIATVVNLNVFYAFVVIVLLVDALGHRFWWYSFPV